MTILISSLLERVIENLPREAAAFENCVQQYNALQDVASVDDFLNVAATETAVFR
jgi:hypothetical protein